MAKQFEMYRPPDREGRCPHGVYLSNAACLTCCKLKKQYREASRRIAEAAAKLDW